MCHVWGTVGIDIGFWWGSMAERDQLENLKHSIFMIFSQCSVF